jgi:hypothetical protein
LAIAKGTDSYGGHLTTPFDHPKVAFVHAQPFLEDNFRGFLLADRNFETADFARAIVVVL